MKRITVFILCALMVLRPCGLVSAAPEETGALEPAQTAPAEADASGSVQTAPEGYVKIEENDNLILYADKTTGDFAVYDIAAGHLWSSGQTEVNDSESEASQLNSGRAKTEIVSMISLEYVQVSTIASTAVPLYQNSYAYCVMEDHVTVKEVDGGYRAEYYFADIDVTVPVEVTLTKNALQVRIVGDELKIGKAYRVTSISLLPGFLASDDRYEGYLFVPSGCGALAAFHTGRGDMASYSEMVYGDDLAIEQEEYDSQGQDIHIPLFGIKCDDSAVAAIITQGDANARINAQSDSLTSSYTRVYAEYVTSVTDSTTLFESNYENQRIIYGAEERESYSDFTVSFTFLSGDLADYSGMAQVYREYLDLKTEAAAPSLKVTLYGAAVKKASFLGIPYQKTFALTSYSQAQEIVRELTGAGTDVSLRYIGWNNSGIDNKKSASVFSPVRALGSKKGFRKLYQFLEENGTDFYFDLDLMKIKKSGNGFSVYSDVCKSIFNTRTPLYEYMRSVYVPVKDKDPYYLLTPGNVKAAAEKFLKKYSFGGGIALSGLGSFVYSDFKGGMGRAECIDTFTRTLEAAEKEHTIALEAPNAYTFAHVDTIYEMPMANDGNLIFTESVPVLQMVLHGSVSYAAASGTDLLSCIEYGADPAFCGIYADAQELIETDYDWLYSSTYTNWSKEAVDMFQEYQKIYSKLYSARIEEHSSEDGISRTVFDNGTEIYINRSGSKIEIKGTVIPSGGYAVIGG